MVSIYKLCGSSSVQGKCQLRVQDRPPAAPFLCSSASVKHLFSHPKAGLRVVARISVDEGFLLVQCFVVTVELSRNCDK